MHAQTQTGSPPYERIGGEPGVRELVERFYDHMDTLPEAREIRAIHAKSLRGSRRKLFMFLSGWLGGPQLYVEKYGHPRLRQRHFPFAIGPRERDQWMLCMHRALDDMTLPGELRESLRTAFAQMAEHLRNDTQRGCPSETAAALVRPQQPSIAEVPAPVSGHEVDRFHARELIARGAVPIDLRTPEAFREGHLPSAIRLTPSALPGALAQYSGPILLYCADGRESGALCEDLQARGYTKLYSLGGGFRYWLAAGERVEGQDVPTSPEEPTP